MSINIIRAVSKLGNAGDRFYNLDGLTPESIKTITDELGAQHYVVISPLILDPHEVLLSAEIRRRSREEA